MNLYGLTGGIGSGKSTVSGIIQSLGIPVICLDTLNKEAAESVDVRYLILQYFGTLDRAKLREIVFGNPKSKSEMEQLMYPYVYKLYREKIAELESRGHACAFYDSALIFEMKQENMFKKIIAVECPEPNRIARATNRDGSNVEVIKNIISFQISDAERSRRSDYNIDNSGHKGLLHSKVLNMLYFIGEL